MRTKRSPFLIAAAVAALGAAMAEADAPPQGSVSGTAPPALSAVPLAPEDELAILRLAARYWWAVDTNDTEAFADTFTPDAVFVHPTATSRGREAIAAWLDASAERRRGASGRLSTRHQSVNHMITMTGPNTAVMKSYMLIVRVESPAGSDAPYVNSHGILTDELRKEGGQWRFARRVQNDQVLMRREAERRP